MSADSERGQIEKLASLAASANIATAVAELRGGATVQFFQRETDAYVAQAGDVLTDDGLAAWLQGREAEMQRAWAADIAAITGVGVEPPARMAPPSSAILLEAAAAWKRGEASDEHMKVLFDAVTQMRGGQFMQRVEREAALAQRAGEDPNQRLAQHRDEMRELFRADLSQIIREAGG